MATAPPQLSDEQLSEVLSLASGADSIELKLTIPLSEQRSAAESLDLDPLDAEIRQVFFFETPELALFEAGVVVRARRVQRKGDDSVVKLRPVVPGEMPDEFRQSPNMVVEVDAMPGGFVCSGSLKRDLQSLTKVREAVRGDRPVRKLFSKEQRAYFAAHAPEGIELDDLQIFGPIFVLKAKTVSGRVQSQGGGRGVALPGLHAHPRVVHQVRARRGIRRGSALACLPDRARHRPIGRAADQDAHGARVLQPSSSVIPLITR